MENRMDTYSTTSSSSISGSMENCYDNASSSGGRQTSDGSLAIRANELPKALAEDQNKFIHLDPVPDFKDKTEIKPWLQKIFYPQGIEIVIERSDNIKVIFKCKAAKRGKNTNSKKDEGISANSGGFSNIESPTTSSSPASATIVSKKKRSVSRFNTCPFRIRATFSLKRRKWNIVVVNNSHSHELRFNPDSDEYRKFKEKLREDNDWDAVKQFDGLEYKARCNLPIESSLIPCECGLTSEIESFSIVLPSTNPTQNDNNNNSNSNNNNNISNGIKSSSGMAPVITKPKSKKSHQQQQQRHRENLMKNTSAEHLFVQSQLQQGCPIEFLDPLAFTDSFASSPSSSTITPGQQQPQQQLNQHQDSLHMDDPLTGLNEIDFTDIFKPHSIHLQDLHLNSQQEPNEPGFLQPSQSSPLQFTDTTHETSVRRDEFPSLLFSPLDAATNEMMTPTDEMLVSPSHQVSNNNNNDRNNSNGGDNGNDNQQQHEQWHTGVLFNDQQQRQQQQQQQQQQPILRQNFNENEILAPARLTSLWSSEQQETVSPSPLRRVVNAVDSQSPLNENDYAVDDLLWKMNFENA